MFVSKLLSFAVVATVLVSACSDVSSPTPLASTSSSLASKSGGGGNGGGGSNSTTNPLVVTTPPTVNVTGTWVGTTDGPDVTHTYTYTLTQTSDGLVTGVVGMRTPFQTGFWVVAGTVNGNTLMLYDGPGTVSPGAQLSAFYRGTITGSRMDGGFLPSGGSPVILYKQ